MWESVKQYVKENLARMRREPSGILPVSLYRTGIGYLCHHTVGLGFLVDVHCDRTGRCGGGNREGLPSL